MVTWQLRPNRRLWCFILFMSFTKGWKKFSDKDKKPKRQLLVAF